MTIFISDLADMMSNCAVVISPLSIMMETPGRGPRNEMRLLLCRQEVEAGGAGVQATEHVMLMTLPVSTNMSGPPSTDTSGSGVKR